MHNHDKEQLPPGVLERVRALLAKAESTTFAAEAEALTAKAQELMAKYRIEQAMLHAGGRGTNESPIARRIRIDDPYASAKAILLSRIASANGCAAVWSKWDREMAVFGFVDELAAVEELFTSLLVQASAALHRAGPKVDAFGRSRTTRFRRSFLTAYAIRIGQRLQAAVEIAINDVSATTSTELVPLLARRSAESAAAARAAFPNTARMTLSATDGEGWHAGTAFAERADLGSSRGAERRLSA